VQPHHLRLQLACCKSHIVLSRGSNEEIIGSLSSWSQSFCTNENDEEEGNEERGRGRGEGPAIKWKSPPPPRSVKCEQGTVAFLRDKDTRIWESWEVTVAGFMISQLRR
jgi:hypothetical protein